MQGKRELERHNKDDRQEIIYRTKEIDDKMIEMKTKRQRALSSPTLQ